MDAVFSQFGTKTRTQILVDCLEVFIKKSPTDFMRSVTMDET